MDEEFMSEVFWVGAAVNVEKCKINTSPLIQPVAIGFGLNETHELVEKWIKEKAEPDKEYKGRLFPIYKEFISEYLLKLLELDETNRSLSNVVSISEHKEKEQSRDAAPALKSITQDFANTLDDSDFWDGDFTLDTSATYTVVSDQAESYTALVNVCRDKLASIYPSYTQLEISGLELLG
jgi:hypothetical protein